MIKFVYTSNSLKIGTLVQALLFYPFIKTLGRELFKSKIADFFNVTSENIFLFGSARMGLYSFLKAIDIHETDEVILPGYTCVVVSNAVKYTGAKAVYADVNESTLNIEYEALLKLINKNTKAIVIPHNFGIPTTYIGKLKEEYPNIYIIEDCAHTFGTEINSKKVATFGDASFISHEFSKVITTGMGGTLIVNNKHLRKKLQNSYKILKSYKYKDIFIIYLTLFTHTFTSYKYTAWSKGYLFAILRRLGLIFQSDNDELSGYRPTNYPVKLDNFLSYIGYLELKNLNNIIKHNKKLSLKYQEIFENFDDIKTFYSKDIIYVRYPLLLQTDNFDKLIDELSKESDFEIGRWFNDVIHPRGSFRYCYTSGNCVEGEKISKRIINFPMSIHLSVDDIENNKNKIINIFRNNGIK